jgi:hypothetical protein
VLCSVQELTDNDLIVRYSGELFAATVTSMTLSCVSYCLDEVSAHEHCYILSVCIDFLETILNSCQNAFLLPVHVDASASKLSKWSKSTIHNYRLNIMNHFTDTSHIVLCTKPFDLFLLI